MTTVVPAHQASTASYAELIEQLSSAQKAPVGPLYSVYVNRWLGRRAAALSCMLGLRPNQVTVASALCSLAGIASLALGPSTALLGLGVTVLLLLGFALDSADGQVARLTGTGSLHGEWLDHVLDAAKIAALHGAVLVHLYRHSALDERWLLLPLAYASVNTASFAAQIISDLLLRADRAGRTATLRPDTPTVVRTASPLRVVAMLPADYGVLCLTFLLVSRPATFFVAYAVLFVGAGIHLAVAGRRRVRELADAGGQR